MKGSNWLGYQVERSNLLGSIVTTFPCQVSSTTRFSHSVGGIFTTSYHTRHSIFIGASPQLFIWVGSWGWRLPAVPRPESRAIQVLLVVDRIWWHINFFRDDGFRSDPFLLPPLVTCGWLRTSTTRKWEMTGTRTHPAILGQLRQEARRMIHTTRSLYY